MSQQPYKNDFDLLMDRFGFGNWSLIKWIWQVIFDGSFLVLMVFVRFRIGRQFITFGNWFRGSLLLWIFIGLGVFAYDSALMHSEPGVPVKSSMMLLWYHYAVFTALFIWRGLASFYYLRNAYRPGALIVPEYHIGDSVFYRPVRFLLSWTGLIDEERHARTFWKLNENRWMSVWEPALIFLIGWHVAGSGYTAYGLILMIGACGLAYYTFIALNNTARVAESQQEAEYQSEETMRRPAAQTKKKRHVIGDK